MHVSFCLIEFIYSSHSRLEESSIKEKKNKAKKRKEDKTDLDDKQVKVVPKLSSSSRPKVSVASSSSESETKEPKPKKTETKKPTTQKTAGDVEVLKKPIESSSSDSEESEDEKEKSNLDQPPCKIQKAENEPNEESGQKRKRHRKRKRKGQRNNVTLDESQVEAVWPVSSNSIGRTYNKASTPVPRRGHIKFDDDEDSCKVVIQENGNTASVYSTPAIVENITTTMETESYRERSSQQSGDSWKDSIMNLAENSIAYKPTGAKKNSLVAGAKVFSRENRYKYKKEPNFSFSKAEQLSTVATNKSIIFQVSNMGRH